MEDYKIEVRDGMRIDWDAPIPMDDGIILRADVFRPVHAGRYPVLLSYGPYGKGLSFQEGYPTAWKLMVDMYPDVARGSSNKYQNWEVADPEKWVPHGYACIRVDSRGAGRSPGYIDHHSARETRDLYECIEWAGVQPWSNGKVGLSGISYFAANQWRVAALEPPHLAACCVWEGYNDRYREGTRHGGIACTFGKNWQEMQVRTVQHGRGERGPRSKVTGELVCGPATLSEDELAGNRAPMWNEVLGYPLDGEYYRARSADLPRVKTPFLSAANWGGQGLHLRGNIEGYLRASSDQKWLEIHGGPHWALYYTDYGVALQKRFFDHFLKGVENGWHTQPPVSLLVRHPGERFIQRFENEWPLRRTQWTPLYLDPVSMSLQPSVASVDGTVQYDADGDGVTFSTQPIDRETELTGPIALKLFVSSSTSDADIFAIVRLFDPHGKEVLFHGAVDPHTPIAQGWLRASHRKLDERRSHPWRPYHPHDELQLLQPGEVVELDVEIWPTCIVVPPGYRIALTVRGKDYEHEGPGATMSTSKRVMRGCGPFVHDDPADRPPAVFGGKVTLHSGTRHPACILLPVIPAK
jgi:predicted acyl esterase